MYLKCKLKLYFEIMRLLIQKIISKKFLYFFNAFIFNFKAGEMKMTSLLIKCVLMFSN